MMNIHKIFLHSLRAVLLIGALASGRYALAAQANAPLSPSDFTMTAPIIAFDAAPMEQGVIYHLELPPEILLETRLPDASDLCVFNAEGKRTPFAIHAQKSRDHINTYAILALYPLWGKPQSKPEDLNLSFTVDADSRIVPKIDAASPDKTGQEIKGYVIPLPPKNPPSREERISDSTPLWREDMHLVSLTFAWQKGENSTARFSVQTGNDLKEWHTLIQHATLIHLDGPDGALSSDEIALDGRAGKYLRILFEPGFAPQAITGIRVEERSSTRTFGTYGPISPTATQEIPATKNRPGRPAGLEYRLSAPHGGGSLRIHSLQLETIKPGQYIAARVFTRSSPDTPWRYTGEMTFFAIYSNGELLRNSPMPLNADIAGIRLEALSSDAPLPDSPALLVRYVPQNLSFLGQGAGPYQLAWHGPAVHRDATGVLALIARDADTRPATLGQTTAANLLPQTPPSPADGNSAQPLLWALLGAGILLLGYMAFRLARSMRTEE